MLIYVQESIKVNYYLTKFGAYRHCGSEDVMVLGFYVTL